MKYDITQLLNVLTKSELTILDSLLVDVGNSGSSPSSSKKLREWMDRAASSYRIAKPITSSQRQRALSI